MNIIIAIVIGYIFGNIQSAFLFGKFSQGIDIRDKGTANAGASNAVIVLGWKYGVATFLIDMLKAACAMWLVKYLTDGNIDLAVLAGVMAMIGHIFPLFLRFKGGKGIASIMGIMVGLNGYIAIILYLTIILATVVSNYLAVGELLILILFPLGAYLLGYSNITVLLIALACLLSAYKLRENFKRTLKGTEGKLTDVLKKKK
jgi:glycerol-3-phosphate acyltransferase PlsY